MHRRVDAEYCKDCKKHIGNLYATWSTDENRIEKKTTIFLKRVAKLELREVLTREIKDHIDKIIGELKKDIDYLKEGLNQVRKKLDINDPLFSF